MNNTIKGKLAYDTFYYDYSSIDHIDQFGFILADEDSKHSNYTKGNLGLATAGDFKDFSFTEAMLKGGVVDSSNFRINFVSDRTISIGNVFESQDDVTSFTFCASAKSKLQNYITNSTVNYWSCNLSYVIFFSEATFSQHEHKDHKDKRMLQANSLNLTSSQNSSNNTRNNSSSNNNSSNITNNSLANNSSNNNNGQLADDQDIQDDETYNVKYTLRQIFNLIFTLIN